MKVEAIRKKARGIWESRSLSYAITLETERNLRPALIQRDYY